MTMVYLKRQWVKHGEGPEQSCFIHHTIERSEWLEPKGNLLDTTLIDVMWAK